MKNKYSFYWPRDWVGMYKRKPKPSSAVLHPRFNPWAFFLNENEENMNKNEFAHYVDDIAKRTGDALCADNAAILRSMRDAYLSGGLGGCRKYLNGL